MLAAALQAEVAIELCDALAFAHSRLLVHRDIKPSNVLVDAQGRVRVLGILRIHGMIRHWKGYGSACL